MRSALLVFALVAACSAADSTAPTALRSAGANGDSVVIVAPTLTIDRSTVDVKLTTNRKGAQWTAPKLRFQRGTGLPGEVTFLFTPATSGCDGAGGMYSRVEKITTRANDTTFSFPLTLCITRGATDTLYNPGTFSLAAKTIVGADTLQAAVIVDVACKPFTPCDPLMVSEVPPLNTAGH